MSTFKYYKNGQWNVVSGEIVGDTLPIGSMVPYGSTTAPTNWLICDGSAVSRTTYSELFAVIGTSYGAGDGSTTFNLPNYKGRVPVGYDSSQTEFNAIGKTGGSKYLQSHKHTLTGGSGNLYYTSGSSSTWTISSTETGYKWYTDTDIKDNAGTNLTTGNSGNLQPYQVSCFIIKAKQSAGLVGNVTDTHSNSQEDAYNCKHINDMMDYSTTEVNTGKKWIDGKDIYKKVIVAPGTMTANNWITMGSASNAETLVKGIMYLRDDTLNIGAVWNEVMMRIIDGNVQYYQSVTALTHKYTGAIIEYTKSS